MASIDFNNVTAEFPIYNANGRSLKSGLFRSLRAESCQQMSGGTAVVRALEGINFSFKDGDRVGLLGA